jgi:hypothetical protein
VPINLDDPIELLFATVDALTSIGLEHAVCGGLALARLRLGCHVTLRALRRFVAWIRDDAHAAEPRLDLRSQQRALRDALRLALDCLGYHAFGAGKVRVVLRHVLRVRIVCLGIAARREEVRELAQR